jgi:hypothetical protein
MVSGAIRIRAQARAVRLETGFVPTSTIRTSPDASTWLRSPADSDTPRS